MPLLFNILSRLIIAFLPRSKHFYFILFYLFYFIFFNFYFYFILLYNTVLVLPYIDMNPPRDFSTWLCLSNIYWRRQWQPTPVLLPGKSHGWRSLGGCSPWGHYESDTTERLHLTFHFHALEKEMATHSSILAWRIPGTVEPGGLLSLGSHRVGHD